MGPRRLLTVFLLATGAALPAAAQAPDSSEATTRPSRAYVPPRVALSVTAGSPGLGEIQSQEVVAERLFGGAVTETASLRRTLSVEDGFHAGVSALFGLSPAWGVRVGLAAGRANLAAEYSGEEEWEDAVRGLDPGGAGELSTLSAEAALRFRMVSRRRLQPYAEVGITTLRIDAEDPGFPGAAGLAGQTSVGGLAAVGAVFPLLGRVAGRVQATAQLFGNPATPALEGAAAAPVDTLRVTFATLEAGPYADPYRELLAALRLDVGLSLELGSTRRPRGAAAAPPSDSRP